jgi:endonuclease YncB( thermonuclease family)
MWRHRSRTANDPRFIIPPDGVGGDPRLIAIALKVIRWIFFAVVAVGLLAAWLIADAETLTGRVVGISDGDTITVLVERQQVKVRINGIDAPEKRQAFGERSTQNLSAMASGKDARLECHKTDRYGRQVCKVWVQPGDCPNCGLTLDIGHAQVIAGLAWWYREYAREQTLEDRGRYESSENEARLRRWGLWSDPLPVPPWEWRRREWEKRQPASGY